MADTTGRVGYASYLPMMLRGMFDAWTLLCRNRSVIAGFIAQASTGRFVRVLRRATSVYHEALLDQLHSGGITRQDASLPGFDGAEAEQMRRMDVPYFFRPADGDAGGDAGDDDVGDGLLYIDPEDPGQPRVLSGVERNETWPPVRSVWSGENFDLAGLGVALRDAVEYALGDLEELTVADEAYGVRLDLRDAAHGQVSFDWPGAGRRVTYSWTDTIVRLRVDVIEALPTHATGDNEAQPARAAGDNGAQPTQATGDSEAPPTQGTGDNIAERLLRLDHADAPLRSQWAASGFTDTSAQEMLSKLTEGGMTWLRATVCAYGWPGRSLVGPDAAAAASRLLQHADGHLAFRKQCLALMRRAARAGEVPWREVAYVTDTLRWAEGRPQLYGTKFERKGTVLVPCPIEAPDAVDQRRQNMGMEPLADYAEHLARRFPV